MNARGEIAERTAKPRKKGRKRSNPTEIPPSLPAASSRRKWAIAAALAFATLFVYFRTVHYDFVFYDDDQFVYDNPVVKAGLTASSLAWSFGMHFANWHPLTWFTYLLDAQLFGMKPGPFHLENVLYHTASTVLLFLALFRMTGRLWRCAIVAAIFALHPLHVESVAWVAERKDVLSTVLEMAALLLYARYAEHRTPKRYLAVFLAFVLSIMAKPMSVTFPFVLLLLDYWPLRRFEWPLRWARLRVPLAEKRPFLLVSAAASIVAMIAQKSFGTVASLSSMPLITRLDNASTQYLTYIKESFWPTGLGVLYPNTPVIWDIARSAVVILAVLTAAVVVLARRRPYLFTGWFWYLGMLVPVIGLVQVGLQSRADRYVYLPLVGLTIVVVWAVADWFEPLPALHRASAIGTCAVLLALSVVAWRQVGYWKDSRTLFEHTLAVTEKNYIIRNNLGVVLARLGDNTGARFQYQEAIMANPEFPLPQGNLGEMFLRQGNYQAAQSLLEGAVRLKPDFQAAQLDLGIVYAAAGDYLSAIDHLSTAIRLAPDNAVAHSNYCYSLEHVGRLEDAVSECREALRLQPNYPDAQYNLKNSLAELNQSH